MYLLECKNSTEDISRKSRIVEEHFSSVFLYCREVLLYPLVKLVNNGSFWIVNAELLATLGTELVDSR